MLGAHRHQHRFSYLVDVRDEFALARSVNFLIVGSHLTLNGEQKNLQVSLLCEPDTQNTITTVLSHCYYSINKTHRV